MNEWTTERIQLNDKLNKLCDTRGIDYLSEELGLSNLFKYAVPKVEEWKLVGDKEATLAGVWFNGRYSNHRDRDPALALAEAIEKALNSKEATDG